MITFETVWSGLSTVVEPEDKALAKLFYELGRCFAMEEGEGVDLATLDAVRDFIENPNAEIQ